MICFVVWEEVKIFVNVVYVVSYANDDTPEVEPDEEFIEWFNV